jgi:hypothetical protein
MPTAHRFLTPAAVLTIAAALSPMLQATVLYNAVTDFSLSGNPNGVWSYGEDANTLFTVASSSNVARAWSNANSNPNYASVLQNTSGSLLEVTGTLNVPPDYLNLDPQSNADVFVAFSAPSAGMYSFSGSFIGDDTNPVGHTVAIYDQSNEIFSSTISAYNQPDPFAFSLALAAGETVYFDVDTGFTWTNLGTGLAVEVSTSSSSAPEPATLGLLACGLALLLFLARYRRLSILPLALFALCIRPGGAMAGTILYTNGPVNGQLDALAINEGTATANSFTIATAATATGVTFVTWRDVTSDILANIGWAITTTDFGGATLASGTAAVSDTFSFLNTLGVSIFSDSFTLPNVQLAPGVYWLQLGNAVVENSVGGVINAPLFWDENNGPSIGFQEAGLTITSNANLDLPDTSGSETFTITGVAASAPETSAWLTAASGAALLARIHYRRVYRLNTGR